MSSAADAAATDWTLGGWIAVNSEGHWIRGQMGEEEEEEEKDEEEACLQPLQNIDLATRPHIMV